MRFAHEMAVVVNFIGSVFRMTIAFIVPVICYWKLAGETFSPLKRVVFVSLLVMGGFSALAIIRRMPLMRMKFCASAGLF